MSHLSSARCSSHSATCHLTVCCNTCSMRAEPLDASACIPGVRETLRVCALPGLVKVLPGVGHSAGRSQSLTQRSSGHIHKLLPLLTCTHRAEVRRTQVFQAQTTRRCCRHSGCSTLYLAVFHLISVRGRGEGRTSLPAQKQLFA